MREPPDLKCAGQYPRNGSSLCLSFSLSFIALVFNMAMSALVVKNPPANAGDARDTGSIPGSGRSPRGGNDNPLQYSSLENPMDRGAWRATIHGVAKSRTQLSDLRAHLRIAENLVILYKACKQYYKSGQQREYCSWPQKLSIASLS